MGFPLTCVVHFLAVESRALYLFYGAFKSFAAKVAIAAEMKRELGDAFVQDWEGKRCISDDSLDRRVKCVREGVARAIWSLYLSEEGDHECYREGQPGISYVGALNISTLAMCGGFLLVSLWLLLKSGAKDWREGRYLHFTWQLEHMPAYRAAAAGLVGYTCLALAVSVWESYHHQGVDTVFLTPWELLHLTCFDMIGLVAGAAALLSAHDPAFKWHDPRLYNATFVRSWASVFKNSNDAFGQQIEHAVLKARLGEMDELEDLVGHEIVHPLRGLALNKEDPVSRGLIPEAGPPERGGGGRSTLLGSFFSARTSPSLAGDGGVSYGPVRSKAEQAADDDHHGGALP